MNLNKERMKKGDNDVVSITSRVKIAYQIKLKNVLEGLIYGQNESSF